MVKFKIYNKSIKYYKNDKVEYRLRGDVKHGTIIQAPHQYACDSNEITLGDFYIVTDYDTVRNATSVGQIACYLVNGRDINGRIE